LLEEAYEVLDALDSGDLDALREELGDLLLQIVLHAQIATGDGSFRMADVIAAINAKIIRRHPHVWGDTRADDDETVKKNWDQLKAQEKSEARNSRLDGVSPALPALAVAYSYQDRAARVRFDWETIEPVIAKVYEEIEELHTAQDRESREGEVGDLLFAVVNWARWLGIDAEAALRGTNARFYRRFKYVEQQAAAQGREVSRMTLGEMDALWDEAKARGL
jgi:tetrapyrrole methylase family protein/MazG family protein